MTRTALHQATTPGKTAHGPLGGLEVDAQPWSQRAACAGHSRAMEPNTAWEAAFVILAYCDDCPAWALCDQARQREGSNASGVWAGQWLNHSINPAYRRTVIPSFHDALTQISECERRAYVERVKETA